MVRQSAQLELPPAKPIAGEASPRLTDPFTLHYRAALDFLKSGDLQKATRKFLQAAIANPEKWCEAAISVARSAYDNPHATETTSSSFSNFELALGCLSELLNLSKVPLIQSGTWCAIGNIYSDAGHKAEAYECFEKSWKLSTNPGAASNRALIHLWNACSLSSSRSSRGDEAPIVNAHIANELQSADFWITRSLELNPWLSEPQFVQAMINLVGRADYLRGFEQYEVRFRSKATGLNKIPSNKPEWPGPAHAPTLPRSDAPRLLIYGEQGQGDTILSLRYAPLIRALGYHQTWVVQHSLKTLAQTLPQIDQVLVPGDELPDYDFHIPTISLPRIFRTTIDHVPLPPIFRLPSASEARPAAVRRIGLCWSGSHINRNNHIRSAPLDAWLPVLSVPSVSSCKIEFFSLQVDEFGQPDWPLRYPQINIGDKPADWLATANLVSALDLVITVDTGILHLAGSLGIETWCALHCRPYFVYPITHEHCPWYPSVRLFKQSNEHAWQPVFERIASALSNAPTL